MPGLLKSDAFCPECGRPIFFLAREMRPNEEFVALEFHHAEPLGGYCVQTYKGAHRVEDANRIHAALHVAPPPPRDPRTVGDVFGAVARREITSAEGADLLAAPPPSETCAADLTPRGTP